MNFFKKIFLNDKIIFAIILLNCAIIFLQESRIDNALTQTLDIACTMFFVVEMLIKHIQFGIKEYWKSGWNRLDGTLVVLSLPSLLVFLFSIDIGGEQLSLLLVLRLFRVLRFLRVVHIFPGFSRLLAAFKMAMRESYAILLSFFTIIIIFSLVNCALFKDIAPDYFATPLDSIYAVFRICTVEGWYDIPDTIASATSSTWGYIVRLYFSAILLLGGIIGMSFINSIFVDAMVSDNNDEISSKIDQLDAKINRLLEEKEENNNTKKC